MDTKDTKVIDVRLPRDLVKRLSSESLMRALEQTWFDAYARGAEFGMHLVHESQRLIAESKKKRRKKGKKSKRKG